MKINMDFIHKDVNKGLLAFLIALLFIMAGLEVFYSFNFRSINKEYNDKIGELNNTYNVLYAYKNVLNKTKTELEIKSEREQGLSTQYVDVKTQKDALQIERNQLLEDKTVLQKNLEQKKDELTVLNAKYVAINKSFYDQRTQIENLNVQIASLQARMAQCPAA